MVMIKLKKILYYIFWVLVVILPLGCTEYIDLELETASQRLVVDGVITNERQMQYLRLSKSVPFMTDTISPPVTGATVLLSDGYNVEQLREANEMPGYYLTQNGFSGNPGNRYELTISAVDINEDGQTETYGAVSVMPGVTAPDSIDMMYDDTWKVWKILLYADDPPATEDFYLFRMLVNGTLISESISEFNVVSDRFFDNGKAEGVWVQSINAGEGTEPLKEGDVVTLQMCGITETYFNFVEGVQREGRGQYPLFSGPPANVTGNISNGGLGFFTAFSVSYANFVISADFLEEQR
ncbi:DUF4249 domain-containing protein [Marinilabilia sp.]|uniref:DUF4249 domain-containing protein n=1 Tax=Marinilabilia sp. TaxID=2021252 RepID=UPI0025BD1E49|nr:DUF4249 domain-containing protein [Marinilabilia sp.]